MNRYYWYDLTMPNSSKNNNQYKKAVKIVSETNILLQEFLDLLCGNRQAIRDTASPEDLKKIKNAFPKLSVHLSNDYFGNKVNMCVIAKNKKVMDVMVDNVFNDDHGHFDQALEGKLLGYPDCCIEHHTKHIEGRKIFDLDSSIYDCYKDSGKCSPFINNFLSFSTRVRTEKDRKNHRKYYLLNKDSHLPIQCFQFISHMPCRHDCKESIKIGKKIDSLLKKYFPRWEKLFINTLSKPILYFSVFNQYIFDGYVKEGVLYYKKILPPYFPVNSKLLKIIKEGNMMQVSKEQIIVMKDKVVLCRYIKKREADGFLVDFSG